ncbi:unnamed protein product [Acanthoscelides obtectus]|uniref:Uncharacterized protein n=1 Tax=Acanthoscelides obtectus TaxID=200917 RepID=A0A9P0LZ72_ACAOB|nr:unnamed protein product [Acanthoscelides obtectus]CAK1637527.1 hypothetical protein AOBTE_LOCUS10024 [Acanthoscelides obtectus]
MCSCRFVLVIFVTISCAKIIKGDGRVPNPYFHFPGGSDAFMGLIATFAVPIELKAPGDVILSMILEANYNMPQNQTSFEYPPILGESERTIIYKMFERKIEEFGHPGKKCLERIICEAAQISTKSTGVLGDIVHILLTPTSSKEENLGEYVKAEQDGLNEKCNSYYEDCQYSILGAISKIIDFVESFKDVS